MNHRLTLIIILVLASPVAASTAAVAQSSPVGPGGPATPTEPSGPATPTGPPYGTPTPVGNESGNASGGGGVLGLPDKGSVVDWAVSGLIEQGTATIEWAVDGIAGLFSAMPAPGQYDDPSTWVAPENNLWSTVWDIYQWTWALSILISAAGLTAAFRHDSTYEVRQALKAHFKGFVLAATTFPVCAAILHITSRISLAAAPGSEEFLGSIQGVAKLGTGALMAVLGAYFATSVMLVGTAVLAIQYFLVHVTVFMWPLGWVLRPFGGTLRSIGDIPIFLFVFLCALNIAQALLLRFLFAIDWASGPLGPALGLIVTTVGLGFVLYKLPKELLMQAADATDVQLGVGSAEQHAPEAANRARERVSDSVGQVREWRSAGDEEADSAPSPAAGAPPAADSPGVSSASSVRSRRAGSLGNPSGGAAADDGSSEADWTPSTDPNRGYQ